ncbi:MAG: glycerol kinase GlpK [Clostridia bacterium]|nr:glycerol kinase GlpK [Clostridia bacterium]
MKYILTVDAGTTSVRAILYDVKKNQFVKIEKQPFTQIFPRPAWVEHNAEEIWEKVKNCIVKVCDKINPSDIYGIGITNQRETVVAWDSETLKPLANAIVWQCRRTSKYCEKLKKSKIGKIIHNKTGLIPDAYFSATKIKWLIDNDKNVKEALKNKTLRVGTIESFLVYKLSQGKSFVTDITNASRTMLFNIKSLCWDDDLLKFFNIPKDILPEVVDNDAIVGTTKILGQEIKIAGLIGDQQSSLFGQGCFEEGMAKNTYGTGCFMLVNTSNKPIKSKHGLLTTIGYKQQGKITYALEGSVFNAGSVVNWAIDNLGMAKTPEEITSLAYQVDSSEGVYLVPAFTGLGTPYWDMNARAIIVGLTRSSDKRHISRAVLESMAFSSYDVLRTMQRDTKLKIKELHVDGGASENEKLMQFQCDLLQTNLKKYNQESTCFGAIFMTGLAVGVFKNTQEIKNLLKAIKDYKPQQTEKEIQYTLKCWRGAVKKCLRKI